MSAEGVRGTPDFFFYICCRGFRGLGGFPRAFPCPLCSNPFCCTRCMRIGFDPIIACPLFLPCCVEGCLALPSCCWPGPVLVVSAVFPDDYLVGELLMGGYLDVGLLPCDPLGGLPVLIVGGLLDGDLFEGDLLDLVVPAVFLGDQVLVYEGCEVKCLSPNTLPGEVPGHGAVFLQGVGILGGFPLFGVLLCVVAVLLHVLVSKVFFPSLLAPVVTGRAGGSVLIGPVCTFPSP